VWVKARSTRWEKRGFEEINSIVGGHFQAFLLGNARQY
jgi:hypothetical protein